MRTDYFLVFDRNPHGTGQKVIAVQTTRKGAESAQLAAQQRVANNCNAALRAAFEEGRGFGETKTASDFVHDYYIQETSDS